MERRRLACRSIVMDYIRFLIGPDEGANAQQLCVRAVVLFAFGVFCIRIAGRRTFAQYSPLDIIVALIIGSNISRVMTGNVEVVPACSATLTLVVLHRLLAWASMRWGILPWLIKSRPIPVVRDGRIDAAAMRRANLSTDELQAALRAEQAEGPAEVKLATVEGSGKVSVVPRRKRER